MHRSIPVLLSLITALSPTARATWSIVLADPATGEVAVGTATCVNNINLRAVVPVMRPGFGAGATQSFVPSNAMNKMVIYSELALGSTPDQIFQIIAANDNGLQSRQFGIVNMEDPPLTFSGANNFQWAGGVTGTVGTMIYAIQGNILTGAPVVQMAEAALINTPGDMAEKLMASMEAARAMGGDGRCSCSAAAPQSCGSPPPSFTKTAHVGTMLIARVGDPDGVCNATMGCANGEYYMVLNVKGNQLGQPDPVFQLQQQFNAWRTSKIGVPDHIKSTATASETTLPNDGTSSGVLTMSLADWQETPITTGGATVTATKEPTGDDVVTLGAPVDLGNGSYEIPYTAKTTLGADAIRVVVDDGSGPVTLFPFPRVATAPAGLLQASPAQVSASQGDDVTLTVNGGPGVAGRSYFTLLSLSGTTPGFQVDGTHIPLVPDAALIASVQLCGSVILPNTCGALDGNGAATAGLVVAPGDLTPLVSSTLSFATVLVDPVDFASAPVQVTIIP